LRKESGVATLPGEDPQGSAPDETSDAEEVSFASDLTKILLGDTLEFLRAQAQALQAITGLLLTAYVALLVTIWERQDVAVGVVTGIICLAPVALLVASLAVMIFRATTSGSATIVVGSLESAVAAYEHAIATRRSQLVIPGILTLAGSPAAVAALFYLIDHG
jgi:hypothetical protein